MASSKGAPAAASSLVIALQLLFLFEHALIPNSAFIVPSALTTWMSAPIPSQALLTSLQPRAGVLVPQHFRNTSPSALSSIGDDGSNNLGVIDLTEDDYDDENFKSSPTKTTPQLQQQTAPFLSQGEISTDPNLLSPDFNDAKQTRVIIYIILTLLPVLFLVPLMIGSRDLIPLDALPPVELN
jgi:hypothetical protein